MIRAGEDDFGSALLRARQLIGCFSPSLFRFIQVFLRGGPGVHYVHWLSATAACTSAGTGVRFHLFLALLVFLASSRRGFSRGAGTIWNLDPRVHGCLLRPRKDKFSPVFSRSVRFDALGWTAVRRSLAREIFSQFDSERLRVRFGAPTRGDLNDRSDKPHRGGSVPFGRKAFKSQSKICAPKVSSVRIKVSHNCDFYLHQFCLPLFQKLPLNATFSTGSFV